MKKTLTARTWFSYIYITDKMKLLINEGEVNAVVSERRSGFNGQGA